MLPSKQPISHKVKMLVLFETAAGYAMFKLQNEKKLKNVDNIYDEFSTAEKAQENLQLVAFKKFKSTADAVECTSSLHEGKMNKTLKKLLKGKVDENEQLAVGDAKLGNLIKASSMYRIDVYGKIWCNDNKLVVCCIEDDAIMEKLEVACVHSPAVAELMRSIRSHIDSLLGEHKAELNAMNLAVAHSLGRYKVKFNPEKIDTMIVQFAMQAILLQAVSLLDDLDKELNNYVMRCREWYGWHFPELGKLVQDHQAFAKVVKTIGMRQNAINADLSGILPEELEAKVKEEAEISMGTDISDLDLIHISGLCDQIIELSQYRAQLFDYLKNRMTALAPNLTCLLGELVGARLISHAGSLVSLAKAPASTVQILGAEKALFRALKTKKDTPKYGLIYHAQLITQAPAKLKGKMARKLAAKCALATRIDALADESKGAEVGMECRAGLEAVLRGEQERGPKKISGTSHKHEKYHFKSETFEYDEANDVPKKPVKRKFDDDEEEPTTKRPKRRVTRKSKAKTFEKEG
ncbi:snoRNA binding domain protein [Ancylostoma duodenale]|uniref:SnoRNA binding domain protein n=1 Tax=Ancylostoma duodenale TaxID=51022 RepID=A0A0C2DHG5_9BILA|nr:snoRNA binding domain protein [Ancylostoma duodenale]